MNERILFDKVNGMLADSDYPLEIKDVYDLEEFLNDSSNMRFSFYDEIEQLYNQILGYEDSEEIQ